MRVLDASLVKDLGFMALLPERLRDTKQWQFLCCLPDSFVCLFQEVEYVKEEAKMVYLLECLQKTPPPVSSELRLLWQHGWEQHRHTAAPGTRVELAIGMQP